jgi:hypothetical protein
MGMAPASSANTIGSSAQKSLLHIRAALAQQLPAMDGVTLRIRLAAVIALSMSMLRGNTGRRLLALSPGEDDATDFAVFDNILALSIAAWR